jgi:hypothetical protein
VRANLSEVHASGNQVGILAERDSAGLHRTGLSLTHSQVHDNAAEGLLLWRIHFIPGWLGYHFVTNAIFHNGMGSPGCLGAGVAPQVRVGGPVDDPSAQSACAAHDNLTACASDTAHHCLWLPGDEICVTSYALGLGAEFLCTTSLPNSIYAYNTSDTDPLTVGLFASDGAIAGANVIRWRTVPERPQRRLLFRGGDLASRADPHLQLILAALERDAARRCGSRPGVHSVFGRRNDGGDQGSRAAGTT